METSSDLEFLNGIRQNDYAVLDKLYKTYLPKITTMITRNKGTKEDARDVFQEGIVVLFKKLKEPDFKITSGLYNYLYTVCKYIWMRQLKKKHRTEVTLEGDEGLGGEAIIESHLIESEKRQLFKQKFAKLTDECRTVLQNFFDGKSLKEIAQIMGYTDVYVKKKKYKCKEKLVQFIKEDSRFGELI